MNAMSKGSPGPNPASEELSQLVLQAQGGDRHAMGELVARTTAMARRIVASVVHRDQIDDVIQESYLLVFRKLRQLKKADAFKAWFGRLVLHVCYQHHRASGPTLEQLPEDLVGTSQGERVLNALTLRQALNRLPPKDRDILIMRELLDLSYEELSFALRIPLGTVRSRLSSARERLKSSCLIQVPQQS